MYYYIKKVVIIKDKIPPKTKNGANGTNFCFFDMPQIKPPRHATANAIARPFVPNHMPPTVISFISPNPIGGVAESDFIFVNTKPVIDVSMYPDIAATRLSVVEIGHGKK